MIANLLAGCATPTPIPSTKIVHWNNVTPNSVIANIPNASQLFDSIFNNMDWSDKRTLENEAEYQQRIASTWKSISNRSVVFFIPQDDCIVVSNPDTQMYSITVDDKPSIYKYESHLKKYATVEKYSRYQGNKNMQNAFGATIQVKTYDQRYKQLIYNSTELPTNVLSYGNIGFDFLFSAADKDAEKIFRGYLAEKMLGLVIRGKIGGITKPRREITTTTPTFEYPVESNRTIQYLPIDIEEVDLIVSRNGRKEVLLGYAKPH